jgi:hypothetical protein
MHIQRGLELRVFQSNTTFNLSRKDDLNQDPGFLIEKQLPIMHAWDDEKAEAALAIQASSVVSPLSPPCRRRRRRAGVRISSKDISFPAVNHWGSPLVCALQRLFLDITANGPWKPMGLSCPIGDYVYKCFSSKTRAGGARDFPGPA